MAQHSIFLWPQSAARKPNRDLWIVPTSSKPRHRSISAARFSFALTRHAKEVIVGLSDGKPNRQADLRDSTYDFDATETEPPTT